MKTWTIHIDSQPYGGESPATENATATATGGWSGKQPATRNGLVIGGEAKRIEGKTNLKSELDRIMSRIAEGSIDPEEITIRKAVCEACAGSGTIEQWTGLGENQREQESCPVCYPENSVLTHRSATDDSHGA